MHATAAGIIYAATDLSDFLACAHLTQKSLAAARGGPRPPVFDDPSAEALRRRGVEHEQSCLQHLQAESNSVTVIAQRDTDPWTTTWAEKAEETAAAMRAGADLIYQGALFDGKWVGRPDFLRRVETPSAIGPWSYEPLDAKLAREAKGGAVLQIALYSDLLTPAQGCQPQYMHLALGGPGEPVASFAVAHYAAYYRSLRRRFEQAVERETSPPTYPEPVERCEICPWKMVCAAQRHEDRHLSLVAGISRRQRQRLEERNIRTIDALAALALPVRPLLDGVSDASIGRVREQARIQVAGRDAGAPRYELLTPVVEGEGLAALPEPSPGDLFFDIEGDPYALQDGLEYLFGYADREGSYTALWALNRVAEKQMFEQFIDTVVARLVQYPNMHIFHYAPYETAAVKRLMGRHATKEDEVDRLLRGRVFVDLHRAVRQGLRASVESYSLKQLEPLYHFERAVDLRSASSALAHFEAWLALDTTGESNAELLERIEGYNRDDCLSALRLQEWLEELRPELATLHGSPIPRPATAEGAPSEAVEEEQSRTNELVAHLTDGVTADESQRSATEQARWLLAQLLGWHRREKKSVWWEYFRCLELSGEEFIEDRSTLGGLEYVGIGGTIKKSNVHRYRFPPQEHAIHEDTPVIDPETEASAGTVVALDAAAGTIDLKRAKTSSVPHPTALVLKEEVKDAELHDSLMRLASWVVAHSIDGDGPFRAGRDLLLRAPPRAGQVLGAALVRRAEPTLDAAKRLALALDESILPVQGPPGAGKTYTGARMIVELLRAGKRVGITATSHKVIGNLLEETCRAATESGFRIGGIQKAEPHQRCNAPEVMATSDNAQVRQALVDGGVRLAAGTAWLWARADMMGTIDVLFVDEAAQMSLANVLAVSPAAQSLILLGDPRQLEQPKKGVHPPGADVSALEHLIGASSTVQNDRGMFLDHTWRLHPAICAYTSEMFYEGRLKARQGLEVQNINGDTPPNGYGLRFEPVVHSGNRNEAPEEVARVGELVQALTRNHRTWTDKDGHQELIGANDILIVAPYNAQVGALIAALPSGVRVGTVDKFQGQEAPVAIYSLTSSSAADAPRGMEFLFSPNRLNVATSRARCLAVVMGSPEVFMPECQTPRQMRLANAFCRLLEMAR